MSLPVHRPVRSALAWPTLLATVLLLIALLGVYTLIESRRLQQNLSRELEDRAVALIGILEASSRNAIASNALLEELMAQRLLDNARFVDFLLTRSPRAEELIQRLVTVNKLAKVELLDPEGRPLSIAGIQAPPRGPSPGGRPPVGMGPPGPGSPAESQETPGPPGPGPQPGMMRGMMQEMMRRGMAPPGDALPGPPQGAHPPAMPFMWGHRWWGGSRGDPRQLFPALPKEAEIRRFWEGGGFGVAIPAQSFSGVIAVHADAENLLTFRRQIGVERLIEELGRQSGVAGVALLGRDLTVLASSDSAAVGRQEEDPFLREAWQAGTPHTRRLTLAGGHEVYEVVKPFAVREGQAALVRLHLSTAGLAAAARQAQGSILWYSLGLLAVGIGGALAIFWIQARHLAERRGLEATMAREQRLSAVGNLAAGVAHEIRNPLNAISIGLQRLRMEFAPPDPETQGEYRRFTEIMQAEVGRLNTIVDRFLTLARPSRQAMTEDDLGAVLDDLLALLSSQAAAQNVQVQRDLRLDGARVRMDRQALFQALMNLLLNAIQAMPEGGSLRVQAEVEPGAAPAVPASPSGSPPSGGTVARIVVSDSGPGIPAEHLERLFEPYFTTKEGGTGLGLALARKIIREHQGDIQVESPLGAGATFVVRLPVIPGGA